MITNELMQFNMLHKNFEVAKIEAVEAFEKAYPIGSVISCELGGRTIEGEITHAGSVSWSYHPFCLHIKNIKTGKERCISDASSILYKVKIISLPN